MLLFDLLTGRLGLLPEGGWFKSTLPVASSVCGSWHVKPSPSIGFARDSPDAVAMDALSGGDMWIVGHAHDFGDNLAPAYLALHRNGFSNRVTLAPHPPDYNFGMGDLYFMDVEMVASNDVWTVGTGGGESHTIIEHWDGFQWSIVPGPKLAQQYSAFHSLAAVDKNNIWTAGRTHARGEEASHSLVGHWDGSAWSLVPAPDVGALNAVAAISGTDVWAVGYSKSLHWDGTEWATVPVPEGYWEAVAAGAPDDVWLAGWTRQMPNPATVVDTPAIARWDGRAWRSIPLDDVSRIGPHEKGRLNAITAVAEDDVWAVGVSIGETRQGANGFELPPFGRTLVMHWDGKTWSYIPGPDISQSQHLTDIRAFGRDEIWVLGELNDLSSESRVLVAQFTRTLCAR
ncbi:MAG TPA: hypothetical protein VND68_08855 [Chloroflexia bacterium]|nr:hypothetical protein [Chloroflexia bacterium]